MTKTLFLYYMALFSLGLAQLGWCASSAPERPQNITVILISPTSVRVEWEVLSNDAKRFDVIYKPTMGNYKVTTPVPVNVHFLLLEKLVPATPYQVFVIAVGNGEKSRSITVFFQTLEEISKMRPKDGAEGVSSQLKVRGVEVAIVLVVLMFWAGAILLFFNRWGKIRMLLPYQPDYKEHHKSTCPLANMTSHPVAPSYAQHFICPSARLECSNSPVRVHHGSFSRPHHYAQRPRLNSVFMFNQVHSSPEIKIHRKVKSAEQLVLSPRDEQCPEFDFTYV